MPEEAQLGPEPRRVSVVAPTGAKEARATGGFERRRKQRICFSHDGYGRWRTVLPLGLGDYQYPLLSDRPWRDHGEAAERVPNGFEWENCILQVRQA